MIRMGILYLTIMAGSIIMPTEMKKTVPNRSLMPFVMCSTRSAWTVPASRDPARNAPSAEEKPSLSASSTMPKQMPRETIRRVSSVMSFVALRMIVGRK